jgi:hypothetical protein
MYAVVMQQVPITPLHLCRRDAASTHFIYVVIMQQVPITPFHLCRHDAASAYHTISSMSS